MLSTSTPGLVSLKVHPQESPRVVPPLKITDASFRDRVHMTIQPSILQSVNNSIHSHSNDSADLEPAMIAEQPEADLISPAAPPRQVAAVASIDRRAGQAAQPMIQTSSLSEVYEQAGVNLPKHGFSILKIAEMLGSMHIRDLAPEAKRAAVMMALEANSVQLNDIIEDASKREHALNDYENRQQQAFQNYKAAKQQQNQESQAEIERLIEQLRLRIEANDKELSGEKVRLDEWRGKKREEERRIRNAVSHFGGSGETNAAPAAAQRTPSQTESSGPSTTNHAADNGNGRSSTARPSLWKR